MLNLKRNDVINTQIVLVNRYNTVIDKYHFGEFLKIYDINSISKQELLSKFITYINQILNNRNKQYYDNDFEQPFDPKTIIHRLTNIMFPACVFKFGAHYEVATLLDVCENWKNISSAEYILIPNKKESIYYNFIASINGGKKNNIYYGKSKSEPPKRDRAAFSKRNRNDQSKNKPIEIKPIELKPFEIKPMTINKKIFEAARINSRELSSNENIIKYQYNIIKELFNFF